MMGNTISLNEKNNKKRGLTISMLFHTAILMLALYPILSGKADVPDPKEKAQIVVVDFSTKENASQSAAKSAKAKTGGQKTAQRNAKPVMKPVPAPKPVPPAPPKIDKKVLTTPTPAPPIRRDPVPVKVDKAPVKVTPKPVETAPVEKVEEVTPAEEVADVAVDATEDATTDDATNTKDTDMSGTGTGDADVANTDASENDGTGDADDGFADGDFDGDGLFSRKVVYHADVKKITEKEGKIAVDLCVNRDGKVIYTAYNEEFSTIDDASIIAKAEKVAADYKFEKDYSVSNKQCGRLTFVFKLDN